MFRFRIFENPQHIHAIDERVEELLNTFRAPFWLDEHQ
ncbi:unnamed protein product, partial [Rotaria sp. Silwood1]